METGQVSMDGAPVPAGFRTDKRGSYFPKFIQLAGENLKLAFMRRYYRFYDRFFHVWLAASKFLLTLKLKTSAYRSNLAYRNALLPDNRAPVGKLGLAAGLVVIVLVAAGGGYFSVQPTSAKISELDLTPATKPVLTKTPVKTPPIVPVVKVEREPEPVLAVKIPEAATVIEKKPSPVVREEAAVEEKQRQVGGSATIKDDIKVLASGWLDAWNGMDLEKFMAYYSPRFEARGLDYRKWRAKKEKSFLESEIIEVEISKMEIERKNKKIYVSFIQNYRADEYSDKGEKILVFARDAGEWKIIKEKWRPDKWRPAK